MRDEAPIRRYAIMTADYETESMNLGWRKFEQGQCYQVCQNHLEEFRDAGVAEIKEERWMATVNPVRRSDKIIAKVTRWFTANGQDTHYLTAGKKASVPSNLAVYLVLNGFAEAA